MYNVIALYVDDTADLAKISDVKGNVVIRTNVGAISNTSCSRDLIIADGISGKISLGGITVASRIIIRGDVELSFDGACAELLSISPSVVVTLEKGAQADKVTLPEGAKLIDNSDTSAPANPSNPPIPVNPPATEEEDKWTGFH